MAHHGSRGGASLRAQCERYLRLLEVADDALEPRSYADLIRERRR